jgi:hypothetical protein
VVEEPELKFRSLSEAVVLAALLDPDPENPISREVRRLAAIHAERMAQEMKAGECPAALHSPRWPIEAVAIQLARASVTGA